MPKVTVSPRCKSAYISRMLFHPAPRPPRYCPSAAHRTQFTSLPINHPISNASSSDICLEPNEDGDESGWELRNEIDSEWGDWFPPRLLTDSSELGRWEHRCGVGRSWWLPLLLGYVLIEVYYALAADGGCELLMRPFNVLVLLLP